MTLLAACVVPAAPLLVPALAGGSAGLDAGLRAEVLDTVRRLADGPGRVVVVAPAASTGTALGTWDWSGFGVRLRGPGPGPALPAALGVGAWLLGEAAPGAAATLLGVAAEEAPAACARLGADLAVGSDVRLLVVGDGSARRTEKAPGHLDLRAEAFDASVEQALAAADPAALLALDPALARELLAAGRPAWQVLAGAAAGAWAGEVRYAAAPYGVGYLVARWSPA